MLYYLYSNIKILRGTKPMENQKINFRLTKSEQELMDIFWQSEEPIAIQKILENAPVNRNWKDSSVHLIVNHLLNKGVIEVAGFKKTTKNYARTFCPVMSKEEFLLHTIIDPFDKKEILRIFNMLLQEIDSDKELEELQEQIKAAMKK